MMNISVFVEFKRWITRLKCKYLFKTVAIASTVYEWFSPYGQTPRGRNQKRIFSFSSGLTLCWSALFAHTVPTKSPKCWSSRFLMNVYACFCLILLASYTAKLAAYMVGKNSIRDISGIHDSKVLVFLVLFYVFT